MRSDDSARQGYDAPASWEQDVMERWRFAAEIARVAATAPKDWSVRIGVFGKWGTGKTTVLDYVAKLVADDGHIAVRLNPWHAETPAELWSSFVLALHGAACDEGLDVKGAGFERVRKHVGFLAKMGVAAASLLSEQVGDLADEALEMLGARGLLEIGQEQAKRLVEQVAPRRFVVLVDDLDRARPELVPHVLFSLKEILGVGGFSFVLGFDPEIVEEFLTEHYSTRILGKGFLDKIIDFPRVLPEPTPEQILALAMQQRTQRCSFVDGLALRRTLPFVGSNPRSVKRFVQNLFLLEGEVARHKQGEINWDLLLLCQVLHSKSRRLADVIFAGGQDSAFTGYRVAKYWSQDQDQGNAALEILTERIRSTGVPESEVNEVVAVLDALVDRTGVFASSESFAYYADLLDRPHAVTWKEYDEFRTAWEQSRVPDAIKTWVAGHGSARRESEARVLLEVLSATVRRYGEQLQKAADTQLQSTQAAAIVEATTILNLLRQLALDLGGFDGAKPAFPLALFETIYKAFAQWAHFREPDGYVALRDSEKSLLLEIVALLPHRAGELLDLLRPWHDPTISEPQSALRVEVIDVLVPVIFEELFLLFQRPSGIAGVLDVQSTSAENFAVFGESGRWWTTEVVEKFEDIAAAASESEVVHQNVIDFLERIGRAVTDRLILDPATNEMWRGIIAVCWAGLVAQPLQYRAIGTYRGTRDRLQEAFGIDLKVPVWWEAMGPPVD